MQGVLRDVRLGARLLARQPGFTAIAVTTLAIGIGASAAVFSLADAMALRPLDVADPGRIVRIYSFNWSNSLYADFEALRDGVSSLDGLAAFQAAPLSLRVDGEPETAFAQLVTRDYFDVLRLEPRLGRLLSAEDDSSGADPVLVVSHGFWERRLAGDPAVVGRRVLVNGVGATIVGVAPAGFTGVMAPLTFDIWMPMSALRTWRPDADLASRRDPPFTIHMVGRLADGASIEGARAEAATVGARLAQAFPDTNQDRIFTVYVAGRLSPEFQLPVLAFSGFLLALVGLVLVVACVNIANLMLARSVARRREVGVRLALGAGRGRLLRQMLTESLLVALAGGTGGVVLAVWATRALAAVPLPSPQPIALDLVVDGRVLLFALGVSVATALLFGLAPALHASRADLVPALRADAMGGGFRRSRLRSAFVVTEVALSILLLVVAGLLVRGLDRARHVDLGFDVDRLLAFTVDLGARGYDEIRGLAAYRQIVDGLARVPGVTRASVVDLVPVTLSNSTTYVIADGQPPPTRETIRGYPQASFNRVGPGHFATMGIPLVAGRDVDERDGPGAPPVVVVNETLARRFWPGENAVGRRLSRFAGFDQPAGPAAEIVGVVRDSKYVTVGEDPTPFVYEPIAQHYQPTVGVIVRAAGPIGPALMPAIRGAMARVDPGLPIFGATTMTEATSVSLLPARVAGGLAAGLGVMALVLAAIGIYGVLSFLVRQRTREIGVRVAIGATPRDLIRLVVRQSMAWTGIGLALGLALALAAGRLVGGLLYGVSAADPLTLAGVTAAILGVAAMASWLPARRAARIDPLEALRAE